MTLAFPRLSRRLPLLILYSYYPPLLQRRRLHSDENSRLFYFKLVIRLQARLQTNLGFTLEGALTVIVRSDMTPPKVNRFG